MLIVGSAILLGTMIGFAPEIKDALEERFKSPGDDLDSIGQLNEYSDGLEDVVNVHTGETTDAIGRALDQAKDWFSEL